MGEQGTQATKATPATMSTDELVTYAHQTEQHVFPQLPKDQLDTLQPIWQALIERVESTGGRGF